MRKEGGREENPSELKITRLSLAVLIPPSLCSSSVAPLAWDRSRERRMLREEVLPSTVTEEKTGSGRMSARSTATSPSSPVKQQAESTERFEGEFEENRLCLVQLALLLLLLLD
jgi:hypothetical protein